MMEKSNQMLHLIIVLFICQRGPPVSILKCEEAYYCDLSFSLSFYDACESIFVQIQKLN